MRLVLRDTCDSLLCVLLIRTQTDHSEVRMPNCARISLLDLKFSSPRSFSSLFQKE